MPGQPFLQVWSLVDTHENSHARFDQRHLTTLITNPKQVRVILSPRFALMRQSYAHYLDKHRDEDKVIAKLVGMLEEDNLMDDTIIFIYGDHGGVLPRSGVMRLKVDFASATDCVYP